MCECDQIAWRSRSTGRRQRAAMHVIWQQDIERQKLHRQSLATWLRIQGMQCLTWRIGRSLGCAAPSS